MKYKTVASVPSSWGIKKACEYFRTQLLWSKFEVIELGKGVHDIYSGKGKADGWHLKTDKNRISIKRQV